MRHFSGWSMVLTAALAVAGVPAHAQYGGYGWGGWGGAGSTVQGSIASGMGNLAAGAGQYNVQTAQARSINAQTAMQFNEYMYAVNKQNAATNLARRQQQQKTVNAAADATAKRLRDTPDPHDVHTGDALNVVLTDLVNPRVYTQVVQKATTPIDSQLVKNINFQHAANMILISLGDLNARGVPDALTTNPSFESDRQAIRTIVAKGREEAQGSGQVSPETLASFRAAVQAAKDKADAAYAQGTRQRDESDNFLKALLGLSRMLERPDVEEFLKGLNRYSRTTLGHLITFMHSFNLRFGVAKTPEQEAAYDQIYPMLVQLRDQAQAPQDTGPATAQAQLPDPRQAMSIFSGMPYEHLQPPPPPAPGTGTTPRRPGVPR
jgi:hypothetical protein